MCTCTTYLTCGSNGGGNITAAAMWWLCRAPTEGWSADDFVIGFESHAEATACLEELRQRFAKFGLRLHEGKTRLIEFGRFAIERRKERGEGRPETFDFLGFTHKCAKTRAHGRFTVQRHSMAKRKRSSRSCERECIGLLAKRPAGFDVLCRAG